MRLEQREPECTEFTVCTDQSGLVGLVRHLHGLGFVLLAVSRGEAAERVYERPPMRATSDPSGRVAEPD